MQISHVGYQTRGFDVTNLYKLFSNLYEVNSGQKMSRFNSYTITTLLHESFRIFFLFFHQFKKQGRFDKYNETRPGRPSISSIDWSDKQNSSKLIN